MQLIMMAVASCKLQVGVRKQSYKIALNFLHRGKKEKRTARDFDFQRIVSTLPHLQFDGILSAGTEE